MKKNRSFWLCCAAVFAVALGLRLYWLGQKQGTHIDEVSTVRISNYALPMWDAMPEEIEKGKVYRGSEVKQLYLTAPYNLQYTLRKLRLDNRDHPHTNLYYTLFRIANNANTDYTLHGIKARGGALGLALFCLTFALLVALLTELFGRSKLLVCTGLVAATWCTGSLSSTVFFRPYVLQEMLFVGFTLVYVRLLKRMWSGTFQPTRRYQWSFAAVVAITLLATYTSAIFMFFAIAALCVLLWRAGLRSAYRWLAEALVLTVLLATLVYTQFVDGFLEGRSAEAAHSVATGNPLLGMLAALGMSAMSVSLGAIYAPVLLLLVCVVAWWLVRRGGLRGIRLSLNAKAVLVVLLVTALWTVATMYAAPYKITRYVMSGFPLLALSVPLALSLVRKVWVRGLLAATICAIYGVCALTPVEDDPEDTIGLSSRSISFSSLSVMEQTFPWANEPFEGSDNFVVLTSNVSHFINEIIPNFPDEAIITFVPSTDLTADILAACTSGTTVLVQYDDERFGRATRLLDTDYRLVWKKRFFRVYRRPAK